MRVKIPFELNGEYYCAGCDARLSETEFSKSHIKMGLKQCRKHRTIYMNKYHNDDPLRNLRVRTQVEERKRFGNHIIGIEDSDVKRCLESANYTCQKTNAPLTTKSARIMRANANEMLDLDSNFIVVKRTRL